MNRLLYSFWNLIDISDNINRAIKVVSGIRGTAATVMLLALVVLDYNLFWLMLYFDLGATAEWSQKASELILPVLPQDLIKYTSYLVVALTLLPTLAEMFSAAFARAGIIFAQGLIFSMTLFDAITDWPRVVTFCEVFRPIFAEMGQLSGFILIAFRTTWLFMATFGFEMLFVVFAVCLPRLFINTGALSFMVEVKDGNKQQRVSVRPD